MATTTKRTAIVLPTSIVKGIMHAVSTDKNRAMLNAFVIKGKAHNECNARRYDLRIVATDSTELVELLYSYDLVAEPIDTPDEFEWVIKPTDKIAGNDPYTRIERIEDEQGRVSYNVRTYKSSARNTAIARGMAIQDVQPASYHVWETVEGTYPNFEKLYPAALTTAANFTVNPDVYGKIEKAMTTAFGTGYGITMRGISTSSAVIEYAMYDHNDVVMARAIIMPMRPNKGDHYADKGSINGADPAELESLKKAYDAQLEINQKLAAENAELRSELTGGSSFSDDYDAMELAYEQKCKQVDELTALVAELNGKLAAAESENAELRRSWEALCKYAYDEGATVPESQVGIVKSDEPEPEQPAENVDEPPALPAPAEVVDATAIDTIDTVWIPDGCTVSIAKGGNVWLDGPVSMLKKLSKQLKAAGWIPAPKRIPQGKPWWYRRFAAC